MSSHVAGDAGVVSTMLRADQVDDQRRRKLINASNRRSQSGIVDDGLKATAVGSNTHPENPGVGLPFHSAPIET